MEYDLLGIFKNIFVYQSMGVPVQVYYDFCILTFLLNVSFWDCIYIFACIDYVRNH